MNFDSNNQLNDAGSSNVVQVTADTRTTLRAFAATFTASTTVLSELLQNGRRAGASRIDVTVTDDVIVVQDNGIGLDDFGVLLKIAESGWAADVQDSDNPYGIGFISALFSCEYLGVMSKGKHLFAPTSDLINLEQVTVNESVDLGVTEIRLHNYRIGSRTVVEKHVRDVVKGFPVPVYLNGEEVERPHALSNLDMIEAPFGHVTKGVLEGRCVNAFYLQGLPIKVPSTFGMGMYLGNPSKMVVIHLDSCRYMGRMPDRDTLRNAEACAKEIDAALATISKRHLEDLASSMDEASFVVQHGWMAIHLQMYDLLNQMSVFPASWVRCFKDLPKQHPCDGARYLETPPAGVVSREDVLKRGIFESECGYSESDLLGEHFLNRSDAFINKSIPHWHWASKLVQDLDADAFSLFHGEVLGEESVEIFGREVTLVLVESLDAKYVGAPIAQFTTEQTFSIDTYFDINTERLYVLPTTAADDAAWQVTNFETDDRYDESADNEAVASVSATMGMLVSNDTSALLAMFIEAGIGSANPRSFKSKSFTVSFDEYGRVTVSDTV